MSSRNSLKCDGNSSFSIKSAISNLICFWQSKIENQRDEKLRVSAVKNESRRDEKMRVDAMKNESQRDEKMRVGAVKNESVSLRQHC